jgi:hypothetical protein
MIKTAASLSPGVAPGDERAPAESEQEPRQQAPEGRQPGPSPEAAQFGQLARAQEGDRQKQDEARASAAAKEEQLGAIKQTGKDIRTAFKLVQLALSETGLPAVTLPAWMNIETINKWIFRKNLPPLLVADEHPRLGPNDMATGCLNGCCCLFLLLLLLEVLFWFLAVPAAATSNPWQAFWAGVGVIFDRLFKA